jgi:hypothetical protein
MTDRQLGFILPPPPVLTGGVVLLVWLFGRRAKAAASVIAKEDVFKPEAIADAIDKAVRPHVKELEEKKKKARKKVSKSLDKAEKRAKSPAKKKEVKEAKESVDRGKPNKKKLERAKRSDKVVKKDYDIAVKPLRDLRKKVEKKVGEIKKNIEREAKRQVDSFTKDFPKELRGPAEAAFRSIKTGKLDTTELEKLGKREGKKFVEKYAKEFGVTELTKSIPDLPSGIPTGQIIDLIASGNISVKSVFNVGIDAGVNTAIDEAGKQLSNVVGFPIPFPDFTSAKGLVKSIVGIIPTDMNQAIDLGLQVAAQAASGALTAALAGTAIGSVIPGLGTIVGLGVGLLANELGEALKEEPPPNQRPCPTKYRCPRPKPMEKTVYSKNELIRRAQQKAAAEEAKHPVYPKLSPVELLPWLAKEHARVSAVVARDQNKSYCGKGESIACRTGLNTTMKVIYYLLLPLAENVVQGQRATQRASTMSTFDVIGLPEVSHLIRLYEAAPAEYEYFDTQKKKIAREKNTRIAEILGLLKRRKAALQKLVSDCKKIETLPNLQQLRFTLITEVTYAAQQVYFNPNKNAKDWLKELAGYVQRLERRERTVHSDMAAQIKRDEETLKANLARNPNLKLTYEVN